MSEPINVVLGALVHDGRILLVRRSPSKRAHPNIWDLPGGCVEDGESEFAALRRELSEELGVYVDTTSASHLYRIAAGTPDEPALLSAWLIREWRGTASNRAPEEHDDIGWFRPDQFPSPAHPLTWSVLLDALAAAFAMAQPTVTADAAEVISPVTPAPAT